MDLPSVSGGRWAVEAPGKACEAASKLHWLSFWPSSAASEADLKQQSGTKGVGRRVEHREVMASGHEPGPNVSEMLAFASFC